MIHPVLNKWLRVDVDPENELGLSEGEEFSARRSADELVAMTPAARKELRPKLLVHLLPELADGRLKDAKQPADREGKTRKWESISGREETRELKSGVTVHRISRRWLVARPDKLGGEVRILRLVPGGDRKHRRLVLAVAHGGKKAFLEQRASEIAKLLENDCEVRIVEPRGSGEMGAIRSRGRRSSDCHVSNLYLQLGESLLYARLHDLELALSVGKSRPRHIAVWGDSFALPNATDADTNVPRGIDSQLRQSEPMGPTLALLLHSRNRNVDVVYARRGLVSYRDVLTSPRVLIPHDVVAPGFLQVTDVPDLVGGVSARSRVGSSRIRLVQMVDAQNRHAPLKKAREAYAKPLANHQSFSISDKDSAAEWLLEQFAQLDKALPPIDALSNQPKMRRFARFRGWNSCSGRLLAEIGLSVPHKAPFCG